MPWLFKLGSFNELIKKGRYCLLQRTRFLINRVLFIWRLLQHEAEDSSFKLQEMVLQIDGSPIHLRLLKGYVVAIGSLHATTRKKFCSISNPIKAFCVDICMHLMRRPALAASPDHPHHTMANCASLFASAFTVTYLNAANLNAQSAA